MPVIYRLGNIEIAIWPRDHVPPHFHLITPDLEAMVSIETLEILQGQARGKDYRRVREWAEQNRPLLWATWNRFNG